MIHRKPLIRQLYPSYLVLVVAAVLATGWFALDAMHDFHMAQIRQELLHHVRLLIPRVLPYLEPVDGPGLDKFCKQIVLEVPFRITVMLPDGTVAGDSETDPSKMDNHGTRQEFQAALRGETGMALRYSGTLGQQMMYLALPAPQQSPRAVVRASMALTAIERQLHSIRLRIILAGVVIALIASIVCLLIARRISRPLETMRQSAARFAQGELAHRLILPDTRELADLAQAMNHMAQELEQRMNAIVRQRNESEAVLSSMVEGVVALDSEERILHLNAAAARLLSGPAEQFQGRSIQEVVRNSELHTMLRATLTQGTVHQGDVALYRAGQRIFNAHCTPLYDVGGHRMGVLLVMNDVTQLRRLETMRSDFAANVSHEIKTPLTAIQGFVETLCQGAVVDPQETQRFLHIILKHVHRLAAIIDDLMQLARLEQGQGSSKLVLETHPLAQVLMSAAQLCRPKADAKSIAIDIQCSDQLTALIDADLMEQAVVNLLDNAIKYSPGERRIVVTAEALPREIRILVQDQGMGIAPPHLDRIFERFYRVDKARSRSEGGTGLGLAIVKHIVQAHGGQVTVESVQGQGSTFAIHLESNC